MATLMEMLARVGRAQASIPKRTPKLDLDFLSRRDSSMLFPPPSESAQILAAAAADGAPTGVPVATESFAGAADRWYDGKFDAELQASMDRASEGEARVERAMSDSAPHDAVKKLGFGHMAYLVPTVRPLAAYAPRDVVLEDLPPSVRGAYKIGGNDGLPPGGMIAVGRHEASLAYPDTKPNAGERLLELDETLAHELNHAAHIWDSGSDYGPALPYDLAASRRAMRPKLLARLLGEDKSAFRYWADATEVDPRLSGLRRAYTLNTGRPVRNVDDAQRAWRWWGVNGHPFSGSDMSPMGPEFAFYNALDPDILSYLMHRMTITPALLAPLLAPGMGHENEGQEPY